MVLMVLMVLVMVLTWKLVQVQQMVMEMVQSGQLEQMLVEVLLSPEVEQMVVELMAEIMRPPTEEEQALMQVGKYGYLVNLEATNNMVQALIEELMRPPTEEELTQLQEGECRNLKSPR